VPHQVSLDLLSILDHTDGQIPSRDASDKWTACGSISHVGSRTHSALWEHVSLLSPSFNFSTDWWATLPNSSHIVQEALEPILS